MWYHQLMLVIFLTPLTNSFTIWSVNERLVGRNGKRENSRDGDPFTEAPKLHVKLPVGAWMNSTTRPHNDTWLSPIYPFIFSRRVPMPEVLEPLTSYTDPTTKEIFDFYQVTISHVEKLIYPGRNPTKLEGYNGQIPSPQFRVTVGRRSVVRFINQVGQPASVHLHGSPTRPPFDGWAEDVLMPGEYKDYIYPNENARTLWYHDHAVGITARNVNMGQFGTYWIENPILEEKFNLPRGEYDIPLTLNDGIYEQNGQLWSKVNEAPSGIKKQWLHPQEDIKNHVEVNSFYGDIIHVNGMPWPYMNVEPRKYRFRLLDASVGRSYNLTFRTDDGVVLPFHVIGTDSGFMDVPQKVKNIIVAMAERYEIIIDFAEYAGETITLFNSQNFSHNEDYAMTHLVMQLVVGYEVTCHDGNGPIPETLVNMEYPIDPGNITRSFTFARTKGIWTINDIGFMNIDSRVQARPKAGSVEVWELINEAGRWAHPVHIHLVDFQVISRTGPNNRGVEPWEKGYKDVVFVDQLERVLVLARYHPWTGQYMFHCHNLDHEDNDMMSVFDINDTLSHPTVNGDPFSNPMARQFRAKPWLGITDVDEIRDVLLPGYAGMDVYPKRIVEEAAAPLGGGVLDMQLLHTQREQSRYFNDGELKQK